MVAAAFLEEEPFPSYHLALPSAIVDRPDA
jgi:hypothetical protein